MFQCYFHEQNHAFVGFSSTVGKYNSKITKKYLDKVGKIAQTTSAELFSIVFH